MAAPGLRPQADEAQLARALLAPPHNAGHATQGQSTPRLTVVWQRVHRTGGRVRHVRPLDGGAGFALRF